MVRSAFVEVDGLRLEYHRTPNAAGPLVLGIGPHHKKAAHPVGLLSALEEVSDLAPGFALDNPCTGNSSDVSLEYFDRHGCVAEGLAEIWGHALAKLDINPTDCIVFTHCSGSFVAAHLIRQLGLKPRLLILSAPLYKLPETPAGVTPIVQEGGLWHYTLEAYRLLHPAATEEDVRRANERAIRVRPLRARQLVPWSTFKYAETLPMAAMGKIVVIHPERDSTPLSEREGLAAELGADLVTIPNAAHDPDDRTRAVWASHRRRYLTAALSGALR